MTVVGGGVTGHPSGSRRSLRTSAPDATSGRQLQSSKPPEGTSLYLAITRYGGVNYSGRARPTPSLRTAPAVAPATTAAVRSLGHGAAGGGDNNDDDDDRRDVCVGWIAAPLTEEGRDDGDRYDPRDINRTVLRDTDANGLTRATHVIASVRVQGAPTPNRTPSLCSLPLVSDFKALPYSRCGLRGKGGEILGMTGVIRRNSG